MCALEAARCLLRYPALNQRFEVVRISTQTLLELVQTALENSTFAIGDLQISARNTHAFVERQRAREGGNRFLGEAFSEVEDTEIVVSARIRWIDSASERSQDVD